MNTIAWLMLAAALLPYVAALASKAGGKGFDNDDPRPWLARQEGWRARANSAQANLFEGLPFFYATVLFALYREVDPGFLAMLVTAWLVARAAYLAVYIAGYGTVRSLLWVVALGLAIAILFSGL